MLQWLDKSLLHLLTCESFAVAFHVCIALACITGLMYCVHNIIKSWKAVGKEKRHG